MFTIFKLVYVVKIKKIMVFGSDIPTIEKCISLDESNNVFIFNKREAYTFLKYYKINMCSQTSIADFRSLYITLL